MSFVTRYHNLDFMLKASGLPAAKSQEIYVFAISDIADPNLDMGSFSHNYFELSYNSNLEMSISIGNNQQDDTRDHIWFSSPHQIFNWNMTGGALIGESWTVLFKPSILASIHNPLDIYRYFPFFNRNTRAFYSIEQSVKSEIIALFKKMHQEHKVYDSHSKNLLQAYLSTILHLCKRHLGLEQVRRLGLSRADEIAFRFESLIQKGGGLKKSIQHYADILNISPVYLAECIKSSTGKSPRHIIDEYVLISAKSLLSNSELSLEEIADQLGYSDRSSFGKFFKKQTGKSPLGYRKHKY